MNKDLKLKTERFKFEFLCFYKELNGGVYDLYVHDKCIGVGVSEKDLKKLIKILKLNSVVK